MEDAVSYCQRLELEGYDELSMRKAVRTYFGFGIDELGKFFEQYPVARYRYLKRIVGAERSHRTRYSCEVYVSRNLGIARERAVYWVNQLVARGDIRAFKVD